MHTLLQNECFVSKQVESGGATAIGVELWSMYTQQAFRLRGRQRTTTSSTNFLDHYHQLTFPIHLIAAKHDRLVLPINIYHHFQVLQRRHRNPSHVLWHQLDSSGHIDCIQGEIGPLVQYLQRYWLPNPDQDSFATSITPEVPRPSL